MEDVQTMENLFNLAFEIEKKLVDFYCRLRNMFSHMPRVEDFWLGLRDDEIDHITKLQEIRGILKPKQLSAPADEYILKKAEHVLEILSSDRWKSIGDLNEAYELAHEWENFEANQVFLFLTVKCIPDKERRKLVEVVIEDHLEKLIGFPDKFGDVKSRELIKAKEI